ncbi:Transcriptional regulator, TetR family [Arcticibacter svalbardensis MN12-7]|uniref:Transcriptional regulator, TetR family n=1 Tax=Arcticibacter svalbardensis MN12-7 TaxID=1150600 RepID=R9GRR3_9SPHI|nr:TetR/AcrR family transcriptional regulator [Arcticibacter svalbardensis]EOR94388.1 Transcriptional regulator, TetR family [Arcticibacter svalbardensis MN12-7]
MASKDRIQRLKEDTRCNILEAALEIVNEDGWQALSMRKIADKIDYTAPIIYEYFSNKEGILLELTRKGNLMLLQEFRAAKAKHTLPEKQLEEMWIAYWNFAFINQQLYKLMFGVDTNCCETKTMLAEAVSIRKLVQDTIAEIMTSNPPSEEVICRKYYTFWSIIHGLISINLVQKGTNEEMNQHILKDAIKGIIRSIND